VHVVQAPVLMHAAMPSIMVDNLDGEPDKIWMEEELFPLDFMADHNRELSKMQRLLYSLNEAPLPLIISGTYYTLKTEGETENICFIE